MSQLIIKKRYEYPSERKAWNSVKRDARPGEVFLLAREHTVDDWRFRVVDHSPVPPPITASSTGEQLGFAMGRAPAPAAYIERYSCSHAKCGRVCTDGGFGPGELSAKRFCKQHHKALWAKVMG